MKTRNIPGTPNTKIERTPISTPGGSRVREEKIVVTVRLRPLNKREQLAKDNVSWECIDDHSIVYKPFPNERAAQRQVGETALNDTSSRSHQIIKLTIESTLQDTSDCVRSFVSSLNLVDLAGSERASQTNADGARLREGCHINLSLMTLTTVIRKLSVGKRSGHIPYRDSKLTRILQHSLGGNARTAIICTLSPASSHVEQSRNTLFFATRAKEVTNNAQVNMSEQLKIMMMQKQIYQWPPLSAKYFSLVRPNLEPQKDDTIHDQFLHGRHRIPELLRRLTSKTIRLPRLKSEDYKFIAQGCLSSSPDDPSSVLLLTRIDKPIIHFCQLERKQKRIKWMKMSLAKQLRGLTGDNDATLHCLACCNGKLYALTRSYKTEFIIHVDIMVKDGKLVINLLRFVDIPSHSFNNGISFDSEAKKRLSVVYLFRLDMTSMVWEEVEDLKDAILSVDLAHDCSVFYRPTIASEAGGYLHIIVNWAKK
ncbi:kinesin-like protein NACK1 [Tanacetum coccineum]|uniref:Kinesin-like protein n=1 Tax=Tanacetum coccineum TaxID=301880 RepID=A0ABQ5FQU8_9ASTR